MPETTVAQRPQAPVVVHQEQPGGEQVTPPSPKTPEPPPIPSVAEFRAGGEKEKEVAMDEQTRKNVRDRLEERIRIAKFLEKEERPLTQIDRILLKSGDTVTKKIEATQGNLTREEAAVAYYSLFDEAIQKFLASGKVAALTIREGKIGEKGHFFWRKDVTGAVQEMQTTPLEQRQSTEYTRKLGFETWSEERIDAELKSLTSLIHTVESSLLGLSPSDILLDERLSTLSPLMISGKTGNFLRDQVFDELMGPEGILTQRHGGKTFLELWNEDSVIALGALHEANQRALTTFAEELATKLLKAEKPEVDTNLTNLIEQQARKLKEGPKPEEIDPLTNETLKTNQAKLETLNNDLGGVEREIKELETREEYGREELAEEAGKRLASLEEKKLSILKNQLSVKADLESFQLTLDEALKTHNAPEKRLERQEKAKALRKWNEVVGGYDKIVNARFSQKYTDDYARERLASIKETETGEIEGAEKIREHIFRLVLENKADYDPELARKMLSDEAIARAIIWVYKVDPETVTDTDGKISTKLALPYLRSSQFQVGDLIRFIAHEGVKSAERGNPYLALDKYFETPEAELKLDVESIYRDGLGNVEIDLEDNTVTWTGSVPSSTMQGLYINDLPTTYRITQQISPLNDIYSAEILTNQRFLQSLPENIHGISLLPEVIKNAFYDQDGNLRASRQSPGSLTMFYQESRNNTDEALNDLNTTVSPEASRLITASVADFVLKKSPQERLEILRGLEGNIPIANVGIPSVDSDGTVINDYRNYTIDLDNSGNLFITHIDYTANPRKYELKHFYQITLENFTKSLNTISLDARQRATLKIPFLQIQSALGSAVLRTLQRR